MDTESFGAIVDDFAEPTNNGNGDAGGDNSGVSGAADGERINGYAAVNPGGSGSDSGSGTARRRGRPKGSRNATAGKPQAKTSNISALENILLSVHFGVSALLSTPELQLNEEEAHRLAGSLARISNLYNDRINPRIVAWVDLISVAGAIYGPRAIAISANASAKKAERPVTIPTTAAPVPINRNPKQQPGNQPRSPVEMFGDMNFGAIIPDAM